ncbi:MAG: DoxX family protein [Bacteroidales bacterium]|nr:DoxX family protein [Bacteroidales bacterium]
MLSRLFLGALFIVAAVLKLLSIDAFEVYIYSFGLCSYTWTTFFSRLLIFTELFLGLSLIFKIHFRRIWQLAMLLMLSFTLFLVYAAIFRNDSNCHCFGSLIELDPWQSIVKNIIIIALLLLIRKEESHAYRPVQRKWLFGGILVLSLAIPFVAVPMDVVYNRIYSEKENINTSAFYQSLSDSTYMDFLNVLPEKTADSVVFEHETRLMDVSSGRYLINYALSGCKFCKTGAEKLSLMFDRHGISHDKLKFVVIGSDYSISEFVKVTSTYDYPHWRISLPKMMDITFGNFPLYVLVEDGKVIMAGDFRILDDDLIMSLQ